MNQVTLTRNLSDLIQEWRLTKRELLCLFGQDEASDEILITMVADASVEKTEYLHRLLAIRDLIHILYPQTHHSDCPRRPNSHFDGRSLIQVISDHPIAGSREVHTYLMGTVHGGYL